MSWASGISLAFFAALSRPRWWAIALASFLVRGGIVAVVVPIMTLPTVATLSSLASPTIAAIAFGNPPPEMIVTYALLGAMLGAWFAVAIVAGARLDVALIDDTAREEELQIGGPVSGLPLRRAATVRLLAHAWTLVAALYAVVRLVFEGYGEIFSPGDPNVPLAWRIALRAPDAIVVLLGAWLAGEGLGGLAVRRLLAGDSVAAALANGLRQLLRPSGLATVAITNTGVALTLLPLWLAASRAWNEARAFLVDDAPATLVIAALLLLVLTFFLGLALLAAGLAWRSAAWTAEAYRRNAGVTPAVAQASEPTR